MSAFLILGGNNKSRFENVLSLYQKIKPDLKPEKDPDTQMLKDQESIGIEEVRNLQRVLSLKPYDKPPKVAIIQADILTPESQTALLKILEEPPGETIFFLFAPNANLLFPTILSRCQIINLPPESEIQISETEKDKEKEFLKKLLSSSSGTRLIMAEREGIYKTRPEAERFCQIQILLWRERLLANSDLETLNVLKQIHKTLRYLQANVNARLAIENLLLLYPSRPKV